MVKQLGLFIDTDNIVRCEGRISQSTLSESAKQPILQTANTPSFISLALSLFVSVFDCLFDCLFLQVSLFLSVCW